MLGNPCDLSRHVLPISLENYTSLCEISSLCKKLLENKKHIRFHCVPERHGKTWDSGDISLPQAASTYTPLFIVRPQSLQVQDIPFDLSCLFLLNFHFRNGVRFIIVGLPIAKYQAHKQYHKALQCTCGYRLCVLLSPEAFLSWGILILRHCQPSEDFRE